MFCSLVNLLIFKNDWSTQHIESDPYFLKPDPWREAEADLKCYAFKPQATPFGLALPVDVYKSEMNLIVFNQTHAFITIPGELSCLYDKRLKDVGKRLGFSHVSIFGLTNDAHGYIILPESWQHKTFESGLSFGGENYGDITEKRAETLLNTFSPQQSSK